MQMKHPGSQAGRMSGDDESFLREVLDKTRTRLLDTTKRNRLLNYKEASRDIAIVGESPEQMFDRLVNEGGSFQFRPRAESSDSARGAAPVGDGPPTPALLAIATEEAGPDHIDGYLQTPFSERDLDRRLDKLYREHRMLIEETGANSLYLVLGFLEWADEDATALSQRAPLILIPVRLDRRRTPGSEAYSLLPDEQALDTNYCLAEKLREFGVALPVLDWTPAAGPEEEGGERFTPDSYWRRVRIAIGQMNDRGWQVVPQATLGLFRFSKQVMWHDLDPARWPGHTPLTDKPMIQRVLIGPSEHDRPPGPLTDEHSPDDGSGRAELVLIRDADSSQYSALVDALARDDGLVIEGPPGTGKSQTITNLIAAALYQGKTVLFVAEKMAALRVVFKRLEEAGLGQFCLQLHGLSTSKKELLTDVGQRLRYTAPKLETLAARRQEQERTRQELLEFSRALTRKVGPEQLPLHDVVWRVERLRHTLPDGYQPVAIEDVATMRLESFQRTRNLLNDLGREWAAIPEGARQAWMGFLPERYKDAHQRELQTTLEAALDSVTLVDEWLRRDGVVAAVPDLARVDRLWRLGALDADSVLPALRPGADPALVHVVLQSDQLAALGELMDRTDAYLQAVSTVNEVFDYQAPDADERARTIHRYIDPVIHVACSPDTKVGGLNAERDRFSAIIAALGGLSTEAAPVTELTGSPAVRLADYAELGKRAAALAEGPADLSLHGCPAHAKAVAGNYLASAKERADELATRAEALSGFRFDRCGDTGDLRQAYEHIRSRVGSWFPLFSREYRQSKRRIRNVLTEPKGFSRKPEFMDRLASLVSFRESADAFSADDTLRLALGALFKGLGTEWPRLSALLAFAAKLRDSIGPEAAQRILGDWDAHVEKMTSVERSLRDTTAAVAEFAASHPLPDSLWQRPVTEIAATLAPHRDRLASAAQSMSAQWCSQTCSLTGALAAADTQGRARQAEHAIESHRTFPALFEGRWARAATRVEPLRDVRAWLQQAMATPGMDVRLLSWLVPSVDGVDSARCVGLVGEARKFRDAITHQGERLAAFGDVDLDAWMGGPEATLGMLAEKLYRCREMLHAVPLMQRWRLLEKEVNALGLQILTRQVADGMLVGDRCGAAFEFAVYERLLADTISADPRLQSFSHTRYETLRERFATVDRALFDLNAQAIGERLSKVPVPEGNAKGRVSAFTELGLLRHQLSLKKRHAPIRQLVRRSGNALQALKPCFLMSPLSVAQYLAPGEIAFDLVIMDEASQIRPEEALGAIARSRACVVVGDPKQLPPTAFFDGSIGEAAEEEAVVTDDVESVLDVCLKQLPYRRLRWHYRSHHESLVQFSNERFYDGDLVVFPSPRPGVREYGVHSTYVDAASYRKGGYNRGEAEIVVDNIVRHFRLYPQASLGVAAFNKRQAEEIELLLDKVRRDDPAIDELITQHDAEEPLFIKNLENVQGDERDVIFISTTYGPEQPGGNVAQRFGPINSDLGWRRLNVIATRARQRVEVFTSMRPTDVLAGEGARRGVRELRAYLEYAATGRISEIGMTSGGAAESEFESAVAQHITRMGYECDPQVGVSGFYIDIAVRHPDRPGEYLIGIECDGATYHSAKSVRDRDRLRQQILEDKGWTIHRIWSTSWFHTRAAEIDRLKRVLEERLTEDRQLRPSRGAQEEAQVVADGGVYGLAQRVVAAEAELRASLEEALNRFWEANIRSTFPNRDHSILSPGMIDYLVAARPTTKEAWYSAIPVVRRQTMEPGELEFLGDVLTVIDEHS